MAKLHAQWIVGFVDGEGCFHVALNHNKTLRFGKQILPEFTVVQHLSNVDILHRLKQYWKCGVVRKNHGDRMCFRVRKLDDLITTIIPFFEKHPLKTKKHIDFLKFRDIVYALRDQKHLDAEGFHQLCIQIEASRKWKKQFPLDVHQTIPEDKVQPLSSSHNQ